MTGVSWRLMAVLATLALLTFLATRAVEAQSSSGCSTNSCSSNAYCYNTAGTGYCYCARGYYGDGYSTGSGCTRRKFSTWRLVLSIIGSVIGAFLILCLCLACLGNSFRRRRQYQQNAGAGGYPMQTQGEPAVYGYPAQGANYPPQGAPGYANNTNKVPGPAGTV